VWQVLTYRFLINPTLQSFKGESSMLRALTSITSLTLLLLFVACQKGTEGERQPVPANTKQLTIAETGMLEKAAAGDTAAVAELLAQGVDVNMRGKDNNTPIMEAAFAGRLETVKLLLDHGADLSARKNDGETVITLGGGHPNIVELFRNVGLLVEAAGRGDNKTITELVTKQTPVNGLDHAGHSALTEASWNGHTQTVKLLLEKGADPKIKKSDGETPLSLAQSQKHSEVVALLEAAIAKSSNSNTQGK
jgi:ankyrin repeat protein